MIQVSKTVNRRQKLMLSIVLFSDILSCEVFSVRVILKYEYANKTVRTVKKNMLRIELLNSVLNKLGLLLLTVSFHMRDSSIMIWQAQASARPP